MEAPSRRRFLVLCSRLTFGGVLSAVLLRGPGRALADLLYPDPDYEPLDGACIQPQTDEERVVALIVDTVVPGSASDPSGVPGALDCCALNLIYDAFFPFTDYLPLILPAVEGVAQDRFSRSFDACCLEDRTEVLARVEEVLPVVRLAYRFIRSAFYGAAYTMRGTKWVRWPGPNLGYAEHPDLSFGEPLCEELTAYGNLP